MLDLLSIIKASYVGNPYEFSIDLIQAAKRQHKFIKTALAVDWMFPEGVVRGIRRYHDFLRIIAMNPDLVAVPTIEIGKYIKKNLSVDTIRILSVTTRYLFLFKDLAWHAHMISSEHYRKFCLEHIGRVINHDDSIPESKLQEYVKETNQALYAAKVPYGIDGVAIDVEATFRYKTKRMIQTATFGSSHIDFGRAYVHGKHLLPEEKLRRRFGKQVSNIGQSFLYTNSYYCFQSQR